MKLSSSLIVILGAVALVSCEVFYEEKFLDGECDNFIIVFVVAISRLLKVEISREFLHISTCYHINFIHDNPIDKDNS